MSNVDSGHPANVARLFMVSAALEFGAGLALVVAPAAIVRLLFGAAASVFPAVGIVRLTGVALLSLSAACWWARADDSSTASGAIVWAMLIYNVGVLALVLLGGLGALGLVQWTAVVIHAAMGSWCGRVAARPMPLGRIDQRLER